MSAKKFYAVKEGRNKGIFFSWDECQKQTKGYPGAVFKSFENVEEAVAFINQEKEITPPKKNITEFYIDGSFNNQTKEIGCGIVMLKDDKVIQEISFKVTDEKLIEYRNVAGEVMASLYAINTAIKENIKEINIYYDYTGVEKWTTGEWQAKNYLTKKYKELYDKTTNKINVTFVKVKSHSNNKYNDLADKLAKRTCGLI